MGMTNRDQMQRRQCGHAEKRVFSLKARAHIRNNNLRVCVRQMAGFRRVALFCLALICGQERLRPAGLAREAGDGDGASFLLQGEGEGGSRGRVRAELHDLPMVQHRPSNP